MRNGECQCVVCAENRERAKARKKQRKINWFYDHEILWLEPEKQREVLLNPGWEEEWFRKAYPVKGEVVLTRRKYITDLPARVRGKIIAVAAESKYSGAIPGMGGKTFNDIKDTMSSEEMSRRGLLKAKPLGTFYELFEGNGFRIWTNPKEYQSKHSRRARRRKRKNATATGQEN